MYFSGKYEAHKAVFKGKRTLEGGYRFSFQNKNIQTLSQKTRMELFFTLLYKNEEDKCFGTEIKKRIRFTKTSKLIQQANKQNTGKFSEKQAVQTSLKNSFF